MAIIDICPELMEQARPFPLPLLEQGLQEGQVLDPSLAEDKNAVHQ